jgi:stress response protein SCP2
MKELIQGSNAPLTSNRITVEIGWAPPQIQGSDVDISAFLLSTQGKVRNDNDFVFYNALISACGSVKLKIASSSSHFEIDFAKVPLDVERIALTAVVSEGVSFGAARAMTLVIPDTLRFAVPLEGMTEAALIIAEFYRRQGAWKIRAVAQGFNGGLRPLAIHFGVDVADEGSDAPPPSPSLPEPLPPALPPLPVSQPNAPSQPLPPLPPPESAPHPPADLESLSEVVLDEDLTLSKEEHDQRERERLCALAPYEMAIFSKLNELVLHAFVGRENMDKRVLVGAKEYMGTASDPVSISTCGDAGYPVLRFAEEPDPMEPTTIACICYFRGAQ